MYKVRLVNLNETIPQFESDDYYWRCCCFERDTNISISQSVKLKNDDTFYGVNGFRYVISLRRKNNQKKCDTALWFVLQPDVTVLV